MIGGPTASDAKQLAPKSVGLLVAVLAALSATGTLATNILLPSLPAIAADVGVTTAAASSTITIFLAIFAVGQLVVGPLSDRYGRRLPVLGGFAVFFLGSVWCALAHDLPMLLFGRAVQAAGACATSVLSRAIARDLFSGAALGRVMAFIMIAMAAAPGFSPLLGGALDHLFGWRAEFAFVALFAAIAAAAYGALFGESHLATRSPLDLGSLVRRYIEIARDRRFFVPALTTGLVLGALFAMFATLPRVLIEELKFTPLQLGFFFAGTVLVVFGSGMSAARLSPRLGLERTVAAGTMLAAIGSIGVVSVAMIAPNFPLFLAACCVFLFGMGIVNPLGTALTLSPFGDRAGAASALLGFWQMLLAAIGVALAAAITSHAMTALGVVLAVFTVGAALLFRLGAKT